MSRSGISMRRGRLSRLRYAPPVAAVPTQSDRVLVAFAGTGATPVNRSTGNAIKLPPPATAFMAPPSAPAKKRKMATDRLKSFFYHDPGESSKRTLALGGGGWPQVPAEFSLPATARTLAWLRSR